MNNELVKQKNVDVLAVLKNAWESLPEDLKSNHGGTLIVSSCVGFVVYQCANTYLASKAMDKGCDYSSSLFNTQVTQPKNITN